MRNILTLSVLTLVTAGIAFAAEPPHKVSGEFENHCAMGIAEGKEFPTDCHLNWTDPTSKKVFCFGNKEAQDKWGKDIAGNEVKADANWKKMQHAEHAKVSTKPKTL